MKAKEPRLLRGTLARLMISYDGPARPKRVNPKIVFEMLSHSSINVTLDIYSHLLPHIREKAAKALEEALK